MKTIYLNFYGIGVELKSDDLLLVENIRRDFSYFISDNLRANIKILGIAEKPDFKIIPQMMPFLKTIDAICYESQRIKYINYLDKALSIYNLKEDSCSVICDQNNLLHDIIYITILSRIGEKLDLKSIHRIHALGFTYKNNGVLCLSPMAGGKTTLGLGLINNSYVKLISDDTPLITKSLALLPFPIRIGVKPDNGLNIPSKFCREVIRKRFGNKILIDIEYFLPKIAANEISLNTIFIIKRGNNLKIPSIKKANFAFFIFYLLNNFVLARGVAQVKEYFIQKTIVDIFSKIKILLSRITISITILTRYKSYILLLTKDTEKNVNSILKFLEKKM